VHWECRLAITELSPHLCLTQHSGTAMFGENPSFRVDYATILSPEPPVRSLVQQCARFCYVIPPNSASQGQGAVVNATDEQRSVTRTISGPCCAKKTVSRLAGHGTGQGCLTWSTNEQAVERRATLDCVCSSRGFATACSKLRPAPHRHGQSHSYPGYATIVCRCVLVLILIMHRSQRQATHPTVLQGRCARFVHRTLHADRPRH
jgi:hypothetical protein